MGYLLLSGGTVLLHGENDKITARKTDMLIEGDRISKIESEIEPPSDADIIDCSDKLISPGFIDTHHHVWQTPHKGLFADSTFSQYLGISGCYVKSD